MDKYFHKFLELKKYLKFKTDNIELLDELKRLNVTLCTIHPVIVELFRTNNAEERKLIQELLDNYEIITIPFLDSLYIDTQKIQAWLSTNKCYPTPTDLYLGSTLKYYKKNRDTLLLTGNTKDFPYPLYERENHIVLQTNNSSTLLTFFSFNDVELKKLKY